jgi:hypothetical protein
MKTRKLTATGRAARGSSGTTVDAAVMEEPKSWVR